jgi:hypothetical protein
VLAQFMRQVADFSGAKAVVYGGFSAGGRASRMAALADTRTVGWLGLDPVDRVQREAGSVAFPMYALLAPAQSCNAQQMGGSLPRASKSGKSLEVVGTTHCHFESPSNLLCHAACGEPGSSERNEALRQRITWLATAFVRWRAGLDEAAPDAVWRAASLVRLCCYAQCRHDFIAYRPLSHPARLGRAVLRADGLHPRLRRAVFQPRAVRHRAPAVQ